MGLQRGGHELATEPPPLSYLVKQVEPKCHDFFLAKQKFMFPYIHIYIIDILKVWYWSSVQLFIHAWLFATPTDCSTPGFPIHHQLHELAQNHVNRVGDAIQPSHPLLSPSPLAFNLSQHQGLFQWVSSSYQIAKILELQLQYQSFQWIFRTDFL